MTTRKEFISSAVAAGAFCAAARAADSGAAPQMRPDAPSRRAGERNRTPYAGVDWKSAVQIKGTTHVHCTCQDDLDTILKRGIEFLTLSNYYPSAPWCPVSKMTENYWRVHASHPVVVDGRREEGPFDWSAIVSAWADTLPEAQRKELPFAEGSPVFGPLPRGVLEAPNAEHHQFYTEDGRYIARLHMNSPGSAFASGTFDQRDRFKTWSTGRYAPGSGEYWRTAIDRMLAGLVFPDGGGVTVNHPGWTAIRREFMLELLDYDPRVLGIEVIEGGFGNCEPYWDWVLATGRQCFGFFVPDHSIRREDGSFGVNVLVVPERSVRACLRAYREGNFYGAKRGLGELAFTRISFAGATVSAQTDRPARLAVITAMGTVKEVVEGTSIEWTAREPERASAGPRRRVHTFARIKAYALDGSGEELFTQPYMLV